MDQELRQRLPEEIDALFTALEEERARHVSGKEKEPRLTALFLAHSAAAHRETVSSLKNEGEKHLAELVALLRAERLASDAEERWRALEASASGRGPDGPMTLTELELATKGERDRGRRIALGRAAEEALRISPGSREEAVETRARGRTEGGLAPPWPAVVEGDGLLAATDDAYADVLAFMARRDLGLFPDSKGGLARTDLMHLLALPRWDGHFRAEGLKTVVVKDLAPLDLGVNKSVRIDDAERPGKWPGAHVEGSFVSFRPRGGVGDWQDLLAALGRAHGASARKPHLRDPLAQEALSWLLGSLLLEPRFLDSSAEVDKKISRDAVRELSLRRLFALRADAAALRVAVEVERGLSGAAWREAYREALTDATQGTWEAVRASRDGDAFRLSARVLGAAVGEELRKLVREACDEDWWRNPRAKPFLEGWLFARNREAPKEKAAAQAACSLSAGF